MSSQSINTNSPNPTSDLIDFTTTVIPPQLKFLVSGIKSIITTQLTPENHPTWKAQVLKLFTANGFAVFLLCTTIKPPCQLITAENTTQINPEYSLWLLIDQNLSAALYSTISPTPLPYVLNLDTCHDIWQTIEHCLQSTNRSKVSQLKHELYTISMRDLTMTRYLSLLKSKVDALTAAGCTIDTEDIIHYTLNGLSPAYQSFKTAIRTSLQPLRLDDFYSLLCNEETNLAVEAQKELLQHTIPPPPPTTLYFTSGRGCTPPNCGRSPPFHPCYNRTNLSPKPCNPITPPPLTCQIYHKYGHTIDKCWHHGNFAYQPQTQHDLAANHSTSSSE